MSRTTIMADDELLEELRRIARDEGVSLGEVIRQGLEWRARTRRRVPTFIGAIESGVRDTTRHTDTLVAGYVRHKHAGR